MFKRMILALGTGLGLAGSALAQTATGTPAAAPPPALVPSAQPPAAVEAPAAPPGVWGPGGGEAVPAGQFWVTGEYVLGWFTGDHLPPLVTSSPAGTPMASAGVLGLATTNTVYGGGTVNDDARSGFRLGAGYWFSPERRFGVEAGFTMLESQASGFSGTSDGSTIIARPFTDATTRMPSSVLVAFPGSSAGGIDIRDRSGNFYEMHFDLTQNVFDTGHVRFDGLLGYRYYRYDEGLRIRQSIAPTGGNFVPGTQIVSQDDFVAKNQFNGCDFGFRTQFRRGDFTMSVLTKVAVGAVYREVNIAGSQVTTVPGAAPVTQTGGVYALLSNVGSHPTNDYSLMPELGVNFSYQVTPNLRGYVGYSAILLDRVARAADQIDTNINTNLFPPVTTTTGPASPAFSRSRSDPWFQTLNFGLELTF